MSKRKKTQRLSDGRMPWEPKQETLNHRKKAESLKKEKDRLGGGHLVCIVKSRRTQNFLIQIGCYDFDSAKTLEDAETVARWLKNEMLSHPLIEDSSINPSLSEIRKWARPRFASSPEVDAFLVEPVGGIHSYFDLMDQSGVCTISPR